MGKSKRKGMGKGTGKGYKNMLPIDKFIHSLSAKGVVSYTEAVTKIAQLDRKYPNSFGVGKQFSAFEQSTLLAELFEVPKEKTMDDLIKKRSDLLGFKTDKKGRKLDARPKNRKQVWDTIAGDVNSYQDTYSKGALNYLLDDYGSDIILGYKKYYGSNQQVVEDVNTGETIYDSNKDGELNLKTFNKIMKKNLDWRKMMSDKIYRVQYAYSDARGGTYVKDFGTKKEAQDFMEKELAKENNIPARTKVKVLDR